MYVHSLLVINMVGYCISNLGIGFVHPGCGIEARNYLHHLEEYCILVSDDLMIIT